MVVAVATTVAVEVGGPGVAVKACVGAAVGAIGALVFVAGGRVAVVVAWPVGLAVGATEVGEATDRTMTVHSDVTSRSPGFENVTTSA